MPRRVRSLLSVPVLLLAIVAVTVASAPPVFSAVAPVLTGIREGEAVQDVPDGGEAGRLTESSHDSRMAADPSVPADALNGYYVRVSLAEQVVRVYLDGQEIRMMVCSCGTSEKPTPVGRFQIQNRGEFFFSEKYQQGGKWWVSFKDWGLYLFHSVPTNRDGEVIAEEAAKLGQPASHGCIRLTVDNAKWFHDTIPAGAPVDIG